MSLRWLMVGCFSLLAACDGSSTPSDDPQGGNAEGGAAVGGAPTGGSPTGGSPEGGSSWGTVPEQLEALAVTNLTDPASGSVSKTGALVISGSGRDFHVIVDDGTLPTLELDLHSPAESPLDDTILANVLLYAEAPREGSRSIAIERDGGTFYIGSLGDQPGRELMDELLGPGTITWSDEILAEDTDGTFVWSYTNVVVQTDGGVVELAPGEARVLTIDGVDYRIAPTVAFRVSTNPDAVDLPGCQPDDMLGVEVFQVPSMMPDATIPRIGSIAFVGCSGPPSGQ
jgi:hypothetical protein